MTFLSSSCHNPKSEKKIFRISFNLRWQSFFLAWNHTNQPKSRACLAKRTFVTIQWQLSAPLVFCKSWCLFLLCLFLTAKACSGIGVLRPHRSALSLGSPPFVFSYLSFFHASSLRRLLPMGYSLISPHTSAKTAVSALATRMARRLEVPFLAIWSGSVLLAIIPPH